MNYMMARHSTRNTQSGVMLLEALIGILIFSLGILAMVGMQSMAIKLSSDSRDRTEAGNLANQLVGEMWAKRGVDNINLPAFAYTGTGTPPAVLTQWIDQTEKNLPNADAYPPIVAFAASPLGPSVGIQTTITMRWKSPSDPTVHQYVLTAYIN
jgi:type IV pilus assembly protein PilV